MRHGGDIDIGIKRAQHYVGKCDFCESETLGGYYLDVDYSPPSEDESRAREEMSIAFTKLSACFLNGCAQRLLEAMQGAALAIVSQGLSKEERSVIVREQAAAKLTAEEREAVGL